MSRLTGVGLAAFAGAGMAVQARINGELGRRLGDGLAAATISFGVGLILLLLLLPWTLRGLGRVRVALRDGSLRWWQTIGGLCGAFLVATQGITVASIGVAVFTVAVVAGQTASGLAVDRAGLAPGGSRPITLARGLGALLCVVAVLIVVGDRLGDAGALGLAALPALAGVGIAWQQGMNGFVRDAGGSVLPATLINFLTGTLGLLIVAGIGFAVRGLPEALPSQPWLYLGGPLGMAFIALAAAIVRRIGVLLLGMATIAGQIVGALLIDAIAPSEAGPPDLRTLAGASLALAAIALAARR